MRLAELTPDAGSSMPAQHAVVLHRNAGAANHGVQLVASHELGQRAPQRQNHAAVPVVGMHATAAQLDHPLAQAAQAHQIKFRVAVSAAHAFGLRWRQHPVGANHLLAGRVAHQQVLAVIIKQVDVVARQRLAQRGTHFQRKHLKPQSLRFANLVLMAGPADRDFPHWHCSAWSRLCKGLNARMRWVMK